MPTATARPSKNTCPAQGNEELPLYKLSGSSNDQCVLETDVLFPERILLRLLSGFSYTETIQIASSPMLKDFLELLKGVSLRQCSSRLSLRP